MGKGFVIVTFNADGHLKVLNKPAVKWLASAIPTDSNAYLEASILLLSLEQCIGYFTRSGWDCSLPIPERFIQVTNPKFFMYLPSSPHILTYYRVCAHSLIYTSSPYLPHISYLIICFTATAHRSSQHQSASRTSSTTQIASMTTQVPKNLL